MGVFVLVRSYISSHLKVLSSGHTLSQDRANSHVKVVSAQGSSVIRTHTKLVYLDAHFRSYLALMPGNIVRVGSVGRADWPSKMGIFISNWWRLSATSPGVHQHLFRFAVLRWAYLY